MRRATTIVGVAALAVTVGLGTAAAQSTTDVDVRDNSFVEADVVVTVGDTVQWTDTGANPHTITAADGSFDSHPACPPDFQSCMATGETFSQVFDTVGTFTYYCKVHGSADGTGMAGTITVMAAGATPTDTPPTDTPPADNSGQTAEVTGALTVVDQSGDGTSISVASAMISGAPGFVVIHADGGGRPGAVIGHAAIAEGTTTDFQVSLDQPLGTSVTVYPMLHLDAGTVGTYEFPGADGPVSNADGVITFPISYSVTSTTLPATGLRGETVILAAMALAVLAIGVFFVRRRPAEGA